MSHALGHFDVQFSPPSTSAAPSVTGVENLRFSKVFQGDLQGESEGQMLARHTPHPQSAAYVAFETFTGRLQGRGGSFVLRHSGTMDRGLDTLLIDIVPDSGTGDLLGIRGHMSLVRDNGVHAYRLEYCLP